MRLTLEPNGRSAQDQAHSYLVALPHDAMAILDLIGETGWQLTIREDGKAIDRGLFSTPDDILEVLRAEYYHREPASHRS